MIKRILVFILFAMVCTSFPVVAKDMRLDHKQLEEQRRQMIQQANQEKKEAQNEAKTLTEHIRNDKKALLAAIAQIKADNKSLKSQNKLIQKNIKALKVEEIQLQNDLKETKAVNRELSGFVRTNAKDLEGLLLQSMQSALFQDRHKFLGPIILQEKFPSMDDIKTLSDVLFQEISLSGQVTMTQGRIIDRKGKEQEAALLLLGNFTGIYQLGRETGFLLYSDQSQRFFALSKLPTARITDNINAYMTGQSSEIYMDITKGGAIRQLVHQLSLAEQIPKGGALVWPILIILALAVIVLLERLFFFAVTRTNVEKLMEKVGAFIASNDWQGCKAYLESQKSKLVPKVLLTALDFKDRSRQDMENALQEAILGEIPRIERFLSTLGMLAAIAPLLGLLGTVTGMINTFHVITQYGTGDPRMMAGGISEALVTTMMGLSVAIPIMLVHTLLNRRVETQIGRMEEKSVAFVNMVFKNRNAS